MTGSRTRRTKCYGRAFTTSRSLVFGEDGVTQALWDALAWHANALDLSVRQRYKKINFYTEIDPSNGFAGKVAPNATAYRAVEQAL